MSVISASALVPHCRYAQVLKKARPPKPEQEAAKDRGTQFHAAVELWLKGGQLPQLNDLEVQGWLDLLASQWTPPAVTFCERPWGLSPEGDYVAVVEDEPHVYRALDGSPLLTAGRADVAWWWADEPVSWLAVVDWKTGRWPAPPAGENLQVNAAGRALAKFHGGRGYVPAIYYARDGFFDWGQPVLFGSPEDEAAFAAVKAAAVLDAEPHPGPHCFGCWERRGCKAAPERDES